MEELLTEKIFLPFFLEYILIFKSLFPAYISIRCAKYHVLGHIVKGISIYTCITTLIFLLPSRKELVDPSGLSEEQLKEIPYTKVE